MNNNDLMTLLCAFVLGYVAHQMMRNMCGLVEGNVFQEMRNETAAATWGDISQAKKKYGVLQPA